MLVLLAVLGSVALLAAATVAPQPYEVGSLNATITYTPESSWGVYVAPGGFNTDANTSVAMFSTTGTNLSAVNWTTPYPTVTFEWWGYQRSDGGNATISIDDGSVQVVDYYNKSSPGTAFPVLLYSVASLSPAVHRIYIRNQFDSRGTFGRGYGEMNVDHFVVIPAEEATTSSAVPTSTSSSSSSSTSATTSTSTPTPVVHSSNNHAGAIAGGVVGGVAGLALIALALFFLMRRRQRDRNTNGGAPGLPMAQAKATDYSSSEVTSGTLHPGGYWGQQPPDQAVPALYDPNDPRTFPPPLSTATDPSHFPPEL